MLDFVKRLRDLPPGTYRIRESIQADGCIRVAAGENVFDAVIESATVCPITNEPHRWHRDGIADGWFCADCWEDER